MDEMRHGTAESKEELDRLRDWITDKVRGRGEIERLHTHPLTHSQTSCSSCPWLLLVFIQVGAAPEDVIHPLFGEIIKDLG